MKSNNFEMTILVDGKPINEYSHQGSTFIEGRSGSEYSIRIRNNGYNRACFVVSVDGLSVLDGKEAADNSPGYVIEGRGLLDIACYKVDSATGAKFVFGAKEKTYAAEIGKGTDNIGVIAVKVFNEQHATVYRHRCFPPEPRRYDSGRKHAASSSIMRSVKSSGGWGFDDIGFNASETMSGGRGIQASNSASSIVDLSQQEAEAAVADMADSKLGTVFGESMKWETQTVSFNRLGYPAAVMIVYYDNRKNLERRGIKFTVAVPPLPNPFPGDDGCATPTGWRK